jgi:LytR cell envelope-related transcriptional attenuator
VSTAVGQSRSQQAGLLALQEVHGEPGIRKDELTARLHAATGLATSTLHGTLRRLEADGHLEGSLEGRQKIYRPVHGTDRGLSPGTTRQLLGLLAAILVGAGAIAFVLAPDKHGAPTSTPAVAPPRAPSAPPEPAPNPIEHRADARLAAAKHTQTAVLSGSPVPGIAGRTGQRLSRNGFHLGTVANAPAPSKRSSVLYVRGKRGAARALARILGIASIARLDDTNASMAAGAKLVVIVGADRRR